MKKSEWDDRQIEELFKAMPKIQDERSPHEIYAKIQRTQKSAKRKMPAIFSFSAAAAAVMLMIVLLIPVLTDEPLQFAISHEEGRDRSSTTAKENKINKKSFLSSDSNKMAKASLFASPVEPVKTSVFKEDVKDHYILRYGMKGPDAIMVPVTILVDKDKYSTWLDAFTATAEKLPEQEWGFDEFYPLKGKLNYSEQEKELTVKLDENNPYLTAGTSESYMYIRAFQYDFEQLEIKDIQILDASGKKTNFKRFDPTVILDENRFKTGYFSYTSPNGENYLVPGESVVPTAEKAFIRMKQNQSEDLKSIIPAGIKYFVKEKNKQIEGIRFNGVMNLNNGDQTANLRMIEGMLLTARQFGYTHIKFENITPQKWEGYDFSTLVETPISPNKKELP